MKVFAVDASFILSFLFPDEEAEEVSLRFQQFGEGQISFIAPNILPFEVANGLKSALLRGRLKTNQVHNLLETFLALHITLLEVVHEEVLAMAIDSKLSTYDAAYAWLARSRECELLTHDKKLKRASML